MKRQKKMERNKDAVQLKKIGWGIKIISEILEVNKHDLKMIIDGNWMIYPYPSVEDIESMEVRLDVRIENINHFLDKGKIIAII